MLEQAAYCLTCQRAVRAGGRWWFLAWLTMPYPKKIKAREVIACGVSGKSVRLYIGGEPCQIPRSSWWYGMAYPRRLLAVALGAKPEKIAALPGCGCFAPAKRLVLRLSSVFDRMIGVAA